MAAHVVDDLEEISNHHTRYSSDKANAPPSRPPRSSRNVDDREYSDLPASYPSPSHPYEDRHSEYYAPPPSLRSQVPPRSPCGNNYSNSYAPPPARHVNGLNGSFVDREYGPPPAAHKGSKGSFNYDDRRREGPERERVWDDDRELRNRVRDQPYVRGERDRDRERLDWERKRDRERDRDLYPDARGYPGYPRHYAYGPLQHSGNHLAPLNGANRFESRDYLPTSDLYDTRELVPPSHGYRDRPLPPLPPQSTPPEVYDYDYQRQEGAHSAPPTRSYARRALGSRRMEDFDSRQNLSQQERAAWKSEHERAHEDRDTGNTHFRGSPASVPSSSRLYKAQDYHAPPSSIRTPIPPRPTYDDNYNKPYAPARHINDLNSYAPGAPSHYESYTALPPSRTYKFKFPENHPSTPPMDEYGYGYQKADGARPPTNNDSEKPEPARVNRRPSPHEVGRIGAEKQDHHREEEWERKAREMRVKEEELRRKEDEVAKQAEDARQMERDAQRKAEEARRMGEEAEKKAEEVRVKEEEAERKEAEARRMQDEMARRAYDALTPRRPYSYPPAMLSNRPFLYPEPSNFRSPSSAKRTIATSSARNEEDMALRVDKESSIAVAVNTHARLSKLPLVSDSRLELQPLNQALVVESHSGTAMDTGTTIPRALAPVGSKTAPERNQILAGAQHTTIRGGTFASVTGNMYISTTERSGKQVAAVNDNDDSDAESTGDLSLQSTRPAYALAPLLKKHGLICASCFRTRG